jgi:hypothetical protein
MSNNMLDVDLDSEISIDEVLKVLTKAKNGKAPGIDLIPVELYRNNLLFSQFSGFNNRFKCT